MKKDYLDVLLETVESSLKMVANSIAEMIKAEERGEVAYIKQYIRQVAPMTHHYYVLADDTVRQSRQQIGLKKRHREAMTRIDVLDTKLDKLATEQGFYLGMIDAMKR